MKNLFRKVKNISLLVGMCYFFYSSPFANSFTARCNSITRINKLFPKLIKTQINETAIALQINANSPVEDKYLLKPISLGDNKGYFMAVFDGHGGDYVSQYANSVIYDYFLSAYNNIPSCSNEEEKVTMAIKSSFNKIEKEIYKESYERYLKGEGRAATVGSCALLGIVVNNKLYMANLGDSKARMFSVKETDKNDKYTDFEVTKLSIVFNARKKFEQERLMKEYPNEKNIYMCVSPGACYVKGRLQPTRSLGDFHLKYAEFNNHVQTKDNSKKYKKEIAGFDGPYISSEPDIKIFELTKKDKYLLMATDGLWDFLRSREISEIFKKSINATIEKNCFNVLSTCLEKAATESRMTIEQMVKVPEGRGRRRLHDDITMILLDLNKARLL